ncbi:MAG TPA: FMN-binding protein, partial [Prolixibacteraceae bacterium]|nr:FMN-binding protein [Prolixibacteraceae bacterium]
SNAEKESQYIIGLTPGNSALKVKKDGGNIDAITAATISSRAFLDAINRANATANSQYIDGSSSATKKEDHKEQEPQIQ